MTAKHDLDTLDRATLVAWRVGNILKWSVAAIAVAFGVATVFYLALSALPHFELDSSSRAGAALIALLTCVPIALSAIAIGVVIGRHVYKRAFLIAMLVAAAHIALSVVAAWNDIHIAAPLGSYALFTPAGSGAGSTPIVLLGIAQIYGAGIFARRASSKRPHALRSAA